MSRFEDVEQFLKAHRPHGTLTPVSSVPGPDGYLLSLSCSCGQQFQRWVAASGTETPAAPADSPEPPRTSAREPETIDLSIPVAESESLQDVMQQALEAIDAKAATSRRIFVPPADEPPPYPRAEGGAAPRPAPEPPTAPPPPPNVAPAATPPATVAPTVSPASPSPRPPVGRPPAPPRRRAAPSEPAPPKPDRSSLEDALRATLAALGDDAATNDTIGGPRILDPDAPARSSATKTDGRRTTPDTQALQSALRATLDALHAEGPVRTARAAEGSAPRRKGIGLMGVLGALVVILAAGGIGYGLNALGQRRAEMEATKARTTVQLRIVEQERASVAEALNALRDLQGVSRVETPYRVYFNKVAFAKNDVDRSLQSVKDTGTRTAVTEALGLHTLAASAWRAKTLNERERWEAVGDDPLAELCPSARRLLGVSEDPANMSRSQWRGMTLAAGVPLLWDCAAERLTALERSLNSKER